MEAKRKIKKFCGGCVYLMAALVLLMFAKTSVATGDESVQHYKMISTVEYVGQGPYRNQVEELFTVRETALSNDKVHYFISAKDSFKDLSFVVDRNARRLSEASEDSVFWTQVNNHCVKLLKKVTKANIGKTWKQTFNLSSIDKSLPAELKFTLTAIEVKNQKLGEMIAVRALSEPFFVKHGTITSRINTVYLFDSEIEDIYLSISVFKAATDINGFKETLRHEVATYKTNAEGVPTDLTGLSKDFEKFARKLGLSGSTLKVVKETETALPEWAKYEGLQAAQVANMCSAIACEGATNPVATVYMPVARVVELQSLGKLVGVGKPVTVSSMLAKSIPGMGSMKIAVAPAIMGMNLGTAAAVAGGTTGVVIATDGGGGSSTPASP